MLAIYLGCLDNLSPLQVCSIGIIWFAWLFGQDIRSDGKTKDTYMLVRLISWFLFAVKVVLLPYILGTPYRS